MPKVYMNEAPVVQTVGAGGIGVSPPVPIEKVEKISGNTRGTEEVVPPVNRIPNPSDVGDGVVIQEKNNAWQAGADLPDPTNATDGMVLAVEDGKYVIADSSVQTDVADLVADPYSTESTYDVGDIVVYENKLYVCKTAIATAESWTAAHWDEKNMAEIEKDDISDLKSAITEQIKDIVLYESIELTTITGKLVNGATGVISDVAQADYVITDYTEVESGTKIMLSTQMHYASGLYAFYDSNKVFISGRNSENGNTPTKIYNEIIGVPANAEYIVIGLLKQTNLFPNIFLWQGKKKNALPSHKWSGLKWACVGDSLTEYNWKSSIHYQNYIAGATGISTYNMGVSGTGYANGGANNFMSRISNVPTDSDIVTIFGSGNDGSSGLPLGTATDTGTTTLGGIINATIDNLYEIMPVVNLGIITPTPWKGNMPSDDLFMENYSNLIVEICKLRSIPCLDLYHCSNLNPNSEAVRELAYSNDGDDGIHPNELGQKMIATHVKAFLETLLM